MKFIIRIALIYGLVAQFDTSGSQLAYPMYRENDCFHRQRTLQRVLRKLRPSKTKTQDLRPVSYTHLTLPTIYSV